MLLDLPPLEDPQAMFDFGFYRAGDAGTTESAPRSVRVLRHPLWHAREELILLEVNGIIVQEIQKLYRMVSA